MDRITLQVGLQKLVAEYMENNDGTHATALMTELGILHGLVLHLFTKNASDPAKTIAIAEAQFRYAVENALETFRNGKVEIVHNDAEVDALRDLYEHPEKEKKH